jgi:hypothetical protein
MLRRLIRWLGGLGVLLAAFAVFRSRLCRLFGCTPERISIAVPTSGAPIASPVAVSGWGQATQHNLLTIEVRDAANAVIGSGTAAVTGALGQPGPFSGSVTFAPTTPGSPGHIQVFDSSPATGAVTHLASVLVTFA